MCISLILPINTQEKLMNFMNFFMSFISIYNNFSKLFSYMNNEYEFFDEKFGHYPIWSDFYERCGKIEN